MNHVALSLLPVALGFALACSASNEAEAPPGADGGAGNEPGKQGVDNLIGTGGASYVPPVSQGGAEPLNPLFSAGNAQGVSSDDPCEISLFWEVGVSMPLEVGSIVLHEGTLWQITKEKNGGFDPKGTYTIRDCTPPGEDWCAEEYGWTQVGTCP